MKLPILILLLTMYGGGVWEAVELHASQFDFSISGSGAMPQPDLAFEDLDVRDAANQPVADGCAREDLRDLFSAGLFALLVDADIHTFAEAREALRARLNLALLTIAGALPSRVLAAFAAVAPSFKKFLHGVFSRLAGFLACNILAAFIFTAGSRAFPLTAGTRCAPLRC